MAECLTLQPFVLSLSKHGWLKSTIAAAPTVLL
jgi:hypothetical protein